MRTFSACDRDQLSLARDTTVLVLLMDVGFLLGVDPLLLVVEGEALV